VCNLYSTLDLSVLTGSVELVDMMLYAGARTMTEHSIELVIEVGSLEMVGRLLSAGAPLSAKAISSTMQKEHSD
jgi:hypothetical protein